MVGLSDQTGKLALAYVESRGLHARFMASDDISIAVGQHDWTRAHLLNRVKLRLMRMQMVGYMDDRTGHGLRCLS